MGLWLRIRLAILLVRYYFARTVFKRVMLVLAFVLSTFASKSDRRKILLVANTLYIITRD